jgi:hypothetical protein
MVLCAASNYICLVSAQIRAPAMDTGFATLRALSSFVLGFPFLVANITLAHPLLPPTLQFSQQIIRDRDITLFEVLDPETPLRFATDPERLLRSIYVGEFEVHQLPVS